jgi:hypothetical protein
MAYACVKAQYEMYAGYLTYRTYACGLSPFCECTSRGVQFRHQAALMYTCA